ncbi:hypothetical protein K402DRAFT_396188 [Aulographum hederae CBS 113979]|uniref:Uncharacterized protein n=1 Tax=Aulographum hederae CBS 113979 TaxID=1176131 RepID=A0A6G1GSN3_9PEZI|nr:hypothetical protein K402DRAFT_396188 [Aulographum hederae CBS 113979]
MPRESEFKHERLTYTTSWGDLFRSGHLFKADLNPYLPEFFKNGKTKKGATKLKEKKSIDFWKAQCDFRGLPHTGGIQELQQRLRTGPNVMIPELAKKAESAAAEWKMERIRFDEEEAQRYDEEKRQQDIALGKAIEAATKDLEAKLIHNETDRLQQEIVYIKTQGWDGYPEAATALGLTCKRLYDPSGYSFSSSPWQIWLLIGPDEKAIDERIAYYEAKAQQNRDLEEAKEKADVQAKIQARIQAEHDELERRGLLPEKISDCNALWDVTGKWRISCPAVEDEYRDTDDRSTERLKMKIYRLDKQDSSQLYADFNMSLVAGWMRFERPTDALMPNAHYETSAGSKRKISLTAQDDESMDESDNDDSEASDFEEEETRSKFLLPPTASPSIQNPTWTYRWRGADNGGEGEINSYTDRNAFSITFHGVVGQPLSLSGTFSSDVMGDCEFTAVKIEKNDPLEKTTSIGRAWRDLDEFAASAAERNRWGGWYSDPDKIRREARREKREMGRTEEEEKRGKRVKMMPGVGSGFGNFAGVGRRLG